MTLDARTIPPWTTEETRTVLQAYDLGPLMSGPLPMREPGWDSQRARCRLRSAGGLWFLKKHHPDAVRRESHALIRAFQAEGGRAPEIVAQPSGETWFVLPDGAVCEVHRIVPGAPLKLPNDGVALEATEQLARWHRLPVDRVPEGWTGWYHPSEVARLGPRVVQKLALHGLPTLALRTAFGAEARFAPQPDRRTAVHGDLWRGNWVVHEGHIAALTDFDWTYRGARIEDLADLVLAMCSDRDTPPGDDPVLPPSEAVNEPRADAMIRRYGELNGELTSDEREGLPNTLRSQWLRHALWLLHATEDRVHLRVAVNRTILFCKAQASIS